MSVKTVEARSPKPLFEEPEFKGPYLYQGLFIKKTVGSESMSHKVPRVNPWSIKIRLFFRRCLDEKLAPILIMDVQGVDARRGLSKGVRMRVRGRH